MKKILALLVLSISVGAVAQVEMNSDEVEVSGNQSIIVRTSKTPEKVKLTLYKIPIESTVCMEHAYVPVQSTCSVQRSQTVQVRTCTMENVPVPNPPRGPRYNGTSSPTRTERREVCRTTPRTTYTTEYYPCVRQEYRCVYSEVRETGTVNDSVKLKFKNLPALGGSETETFSIKAEQKDVDGSNIIYTISPVSTLENKAYEVVKKGILGFDSYVIQPK